VGIVGRSEYPPAQFQAGLAAHGDSLEALQEFLDGLELRLEECRAVAA